MRTSDLAGNWSGCLFSSLSLGKKGGWFRHLPPPLGWGLGQSSLWSSFLKGPVSAWGELPTTSHICCEVPTEVPQGGERSELSLKRQNTKGKGGNKAGKGPPRNERKGEVSKKGFFPPQPRLLPAFPSNPCFSLGTTPCVRGKDQGHQKASEWTAWLHHSPPCCEKSSWNRGPDLSRTNHSLWRGRSCLKTLIIFLHWRLKTFPKAYQWVSFHLRGNQDLK